METIECLFLYEHLKEDDTEQTPETPNLNLETNQVLSDWGENVFRVLQSTPV